MLNLPHGLYICCSLRLELFSLHSTLTPHLTELNDSDLSLTTTLERSSLIPSIRLRSHDILHSTTNVFIPLSTLIL